MTDPALPVGLEALRLIIERMRGPAARWQPAPGCSDVVSDYVVDTWADELEAALSGGARPQEPDLEANRPWVQRIALNVTVVK